MCSAPIVGKSRKRWRFCLKIGQSLEPTGRWIGNLHLDRVAFMKLWKYAVISYNKNERSNAIFVFHPKPVPFVLVINSLINVCWSSSDFRIPAFKARRR